MQRTGFAFLDDGGQVLAFAHRGGALHPELTGSFSLRRPRRSRRLAPAAPTSASPVEVAAYVLLPARLARRLTRRVAALQIPHRAGRLTIASARVVRRAHANGVRVHVWTV